MVMVIKRGQIRFRIQIYDLKNKKSRTISLLNGDTDIEELKKRIENCFTIK